MAYLIFFFWVKGWPFFHFKITKYVTNEGICFFIERINVCKYVFMSVCVFIVFISLFPRRDVYIVEFNHQDHHYRP